MDEYVALSLVQRKAAMLLVTSFGVVSLLLSAIGLYGVLAFLVTQRFRQIGIRIALGSTPARIFVLVLREGFVLLAVGLILGLLGIGWIQQILQTQLYGLAAMDPIVIGAVAMLFALIALAACSVPARRAIQVDPVTVLTLRSASSPEAKFARTAPNLLSRLNRVTDPDISGTNEFPHA